MFSYQHDNVSHIYYRLFNLYENANHVITLLLCALLVYLVNSLNLQLLVHLQPLPEVKLVNILLQIIALPYKFHYIRIKDAYLYFRLIRYLLCDPLDNLFLQLAVYLCLFDCVYVISLFLV